MTFKNLAGYLHKHLIFLFLNAKFLEGLIRFHIKGVSDFVGRKFNAFSGQYVGARNNQRKYNEKV